MKGFGARERNGLITFCIVVLLFLMLGPVADRLGCTTRHAPPAPPSTQEEAVADSTAQDTLSRCAVAKDSLKRKTPKKRRSSTRKASPRNADPARRSFLDESV